MASRNIVIKNNTQHDTSVSPRSSPLGKFRGEERQNVPSGEEREETDVFAGYSAAEIIL